MNQASTRVGIVKLLAPLLGGLLVLGGCNDDDGNGDASSTTTTEAASDATTTTGEGGQTSTTVAQGPVVSGEYTLSGAVELGGTYQVLYPATDERFNTCERIASEDAGSYIIPVPTFNGDMRFTWVAAVAQYSGPGSYDLQQLGQLTISVQATPDAEPQPFQAGEGSTVALEVAEDNTGSFEFSGLTGAGGEELAGSLDWSCG